MARDENGYVIETVKSRCMIFLLLLNLITTVAVGYCIYAKTPEPIIVNAESSEKEKQENQKFKDNVYQALGFVMSGQSQLVENQNSLNMAIYRIHHFAKPHAEFHPSCPECEAEKQRILEENERSVIITGESE